MGINIVSAEAKQHETDIVFISLLYMKKKYLFTRFFFENSKFFIFLLRGIW